jgi:DNA end-binding protein Ku
MYYLVPSGPDSQEPYRVLTAALQQEGRIGIGHVVMSGKDQVVAIRAQHDHLQMAMLNYEKELRQDSDFPVLAAKVAAKKLKLAKDLIRSWSDRRFDFSAYEDQYRDRLAELIDAKISGKETVEVPKDEEEPAVINLMDALKRSVANKRSSVISKRKSSKKRATKSKGTRKRVS